MKRTLDICLSLSGILLFALPLVLIGLAIKLTSRGPVLYWSDRVGANNQIFEMPKFRTMRVDTPEVATHLLVESRTWITPLGRFLRRTSLDELPQLWSVLTGDMSLVGPRPALHNQTDLITMRTAFAVHEVLPGVTGWAQINGRDELEIPTKVAYDAYYVEHQSVMLDINILTITALKVLRRDGVRHRDDSLETQQDVRRRAA
jgi:O-antigen biosynthesis protein WbqP